MEVPPGNSEQVTVNGTDVRFWTAMEKPAYSPTPVNGEPVEDGEAVIGSVTVTFTTIPGQQSKFVGTQVWTAPDSVYSFRLTRIL